MEIARILFLLIVFFSSTGCSTLTTINNSKLGDPKIFSGTRLNLYALEDNQYGMRKLHTTAPKYPLLDLPGSLLLDVFLLPLTVSATITEDVFYRH